MCLDLVIFFWILGGSWLKILVLMEFWLIEGRLYEFLYLEFFLFVLIFLLKNLDLGE